MIRRILSASFGKPVLTLLLALAAAAGGGVWLGDLKRDVFPDLATPVFSVFVQNPAMGAEELETGVAIPLEVALAGLPEVRRIRSSSQAGVAQVRAEFEPDADYYLARQLVTERVNQAARDLPPGTGAPLVSSLTGRLNEVMEVVLEAKPGTAGLMELRDLADYELRNRLLGVPGVAAVEVLGGHLRQFQIQLDPDRMAALGVSLNEVMTAVKRSNENAAGGFVVQGSIEWTVRAVGRAENMGDLRATVSLLETAVARAPTVETHWALGALYLELGAAGAAEAQLRVAAEGDPGSADRWIALANALALKPDPLAAADALERARSAEPGLHVTRDPAGRLMRQPSPPTH